jgi:hypothetical protein
LRTVPPIGWTAAEIEIDHDCIRAGLWARISIQRRM